MKFTVGLQFTNDAFLDCILENRDRIAEVYFAWGDFPNGRSNQLQNLHFTPWELQLRQMEVKSVRFRAWTTSLSILTATI